MDGQLLYVIGAGVLALILIILILRFAVRPKNVTAPQATGLGLPVSPGPSARTESKPLARHAPPPVASTRGEVSGSPREVSATTGPGVLGRDAAPSPATATATNPGGSFFGRNGCPKCGGSFLEGELEGPTLMVDGVGREDFQPLLTARECSACGYLELYTRPVSG